MAALVYTDIARDGVFAGPNLKETGDLARAVSIPVIASGGVGSDDDVDRTLATPRLAGLIVGTALYEGRVDLGRALARAREVACS